MKLENFALEHFYIDNWKLMKPILWIFLLAWLPAHSQTTGYSGKPFPDFSATALTGRLVNSTQFSGRPTILIVTPSQGAAKDTRLWVQALRKTIDQRKVLIGDILAIDRPLFMSEDDMRVRAKEKIPAQYYDQTWITDESQVKRVLHIPRGSDSAFLFVLDEHGTISQRIKGPPTSAKIAAVEEAVRAKKSRQ
ncbi:hypothetical protein HH212_22685 [Massilia forsythiae]|uniref:Alkyl hydroperoxide reductase subunit C/ Thiol specific antioxidant domain-containing protein n=1 Tax=Massilia forsythiae TaxID=2728020 RepID=A0A7Z2W127_9BURK|nr:hypothetical protein [Massilia forsythiae]QJE02480.1 hypothetical protein HH212_22685 [Massilia forsythiae]